MSTTTQQFGGPGSKIEIGESDITDCFGQQTEPLARGRTPDSNCTKKSIDLAPLKKKPLSSAL